MEHIHSTTLGKVLRKMIVKHGRHTYNASTWEAEAGESKNQGHPWLKSEFQASLSFMRLYIKTKSHSHIFLAY